MQAGDAIKLLASEFTLSDYEAGIYESSGTRRFDKIVRFATVDCVKSGWMLKHKGTWKITEEGVEALKTFPDPEAFYKAAVKLYQKWRSGQPSAPKESIDKEISPEEIEFKGAGVTLEEAEGQAWAEIEAFVKAMNPYEFQDLVADLLRSIGQHVSWISPPGKDGGVDIIAFSDALGMQLPRLKVQVKRMERRIDEKELKSFLANINENDVGLFVSTGGFTKDAQEYARSLERRRVTLVDLEKLVELWIEHYPKLDERAKGRLNLTPVYFLTPAK